MNCVTIFLISSINGLLTMKTREMTEKNQREDDLTAV